MSKITKKEWYVTVGAFSEFKKKSTYCDPCLTVDIGSKNRECDYDFTSRYSDLLAHILINESIDKDDTLKMIKFSSRIMYYSKPHFLFGEQIVPISPLKLRETGREQELKIKYDHIQYLFHWHNGNYNWLINLLLCAHEKDTDVGFYKSRFSKDLFKSIVKYVKRNLMNEPEPELVWR